MPSKSQIFKENAPLSTKDCFYVADRLKDQFNYPLHCHDVYEINYVQHASGAQRIVGDSVETIGDYDLVLIANPKLAHTWAPAENAPETAAREQIHEITIQIQPDIFHEQLMSKHMYEDIARMLERAQLGLCFSWSAILNNHVIISEIASEKDKFVKGLRIWRLLYNLSKDTEARVLASSVFFNQTSTLDKDRIYRVEHYIKQHYFEDITLEDLAKLANMTAGSFSRYFKQQTGRNVSEYLVNFRLGIAAQELVSTSRSTADIAYGCGFNNLSNFNRLFRKYRQMSPSEFRRVYKKNIYII